MLSVVLPVFNEQDVLPLLVERLRPVLTGLAEDYEVLFVDDGSSDATPRVLSALAADWPQCRVVRLARNAGHQVALTAGLDRAGGDWVVTMDADLQDPPEVIPEMLATARAQGVDVIYAARPDRRSDSILKRSTAGLYYGLVERVTGVDLPRHAGDFRLLSARVVATLRGLPEQRKVYRLLIPVLGFPSAVVEHPRDMRAAGRTKYSVRRMVLLASDSVVSFSSAPLRVATAIGLATAMLSAVLALWVLGVRFTGNVVPGWSSIVLPVLFLGTVQLLCVGVLGEYVGRIYDEVKRRPLYQVHEPAAGSLAATSVDEEPVHEEQAEHAKPARRDRHHGV
ncbi:MAG TPA: glycosyltransferase family 2 protein [Mycobacteriales bacterium]|nr:glycosyltransferase family 2 protein [Mycobacteriales bacterium]